MNDEKLDKIFEEAFKVEYRKEFKQELKDLLLKEYDKRKKGRFFFRISTVVAACIVLAIVAFGALKLDLMRLNVQDTSFVKTEMEKVFQQQDTSTRQETEQNDNNSKNSNLFTKQKTLQKSDDLVKSQTQSTGQKQTSNDDKRMSSDSKGTFVTSFSTKSGSEKSSEVTKKTSSTINENKNNIDKKVPNSSVSLQNAVNPKIVKSDFESKTKQSIEKDFDSNSKNESSDTSVIVTKQNKEVEKEKQDMIVKVQEENVLESVYVLKEDELKIDKEHVLDILSTIVSSGVYEKVYFTPQNIVQADVYDGYLNFVVAKRDIQVSIYRFSENQAQEDVFKSVYDKTSLILQKLGIKDYKISVFPKEEGYRAEIVIYFNGYRIFDVDSFIDYSNNADVIGGRIYLKNFSKFKSIKIIDAKTAVKEFEKRYNLKDVEPSDIDIVYRKTGELFIPVYIYIYENKIYWLEK
ncbi:hypothetical protein B0S90_0710 [Caldicellulosiruptor bescii]|uniref:Uncharacterized protein n=2 Tax=Caldicellulosiruptor bescii TaxID=31899 RepID=B9MNN7_CALBD|nr:hypothetical protein [Caldicellulosiruptor bescii]ACM59566.1 conserved hypothetical protein [Caldicellulosiruptor bescii DSM 6725]PBC89594.1 hypothetical protein B0S87_2712 [Caldicellulosiruptor bescii]PBC89917.1 hypothetical protein B0S89_0214 [Caldicellulosiruptor bescii]PBD05713.1 hypothetical protein B0S90_0710 [Caldicellulosiruptor bescii]PBD09284.1 hypothetical protein B0S84_1689 [Caldicellulosiruptor bescii]